MTTSYDNQQTPLAVGTWQGSAVSVFYVDTVLDDLWRVAPGQQKTKTKDIAGQGVAGVADVDGDDADELVFGGTDNETSYVDDNDTVQDTGVSFQTGNGGIGIGAPGDFDGNGVARTPIVDSTDTVVLVDSGGGTTKITDNSTAAPGPVATVDWDGDWEPEIIFVDTCESRLFVRTSTKPVRHRR